MELEKQVTSPELSKKLKKLGVKQESLFYHDTKRDKIAWSGDIKTAPIDFGERYISAFTVAELGEMLPYVIEMKHRGSDAYLEIGKSNDEWKTCYRVGCAKGDFNQEAETEADARAKMLIYLLENKKRNDLVDALNNIWRW